MSVAFQGKLATNLDIGHVLEIAAKAESEASWFTISLARDIFIEGDPIDIGLRMSVYLHEDLIVFKQYINGEWSTVTSEEFPTSTFRQQFKILIFMDEDKFQISINKGRLMFVNYALDVKRLRIVKIVGDFAFVKQIDHRQYFPSLWPPVHMSEDRLHFSHDVPVMFSPGHVIVITMHVLGKMNGRFHLHFRNVWDPERQEVHVSVRFDRKQIVRTSKLPAQNTGGNPEKLEFGPEETDGTFPFESAPKEFKLAVAFTNASLKMAKDGAFLFEYAFRTPNVLCDICGVKMLGINGMTCCVTAIDHLQLKDPSSDDFVQYSNI